MAKINFGKYSYKVRKGEELDENKNYEFDYNHVQKLAAAGKYNDAADYYEKYDFYNFNDRQAIAATVASLRRQARQTQAIYANMNESDVSDVKFANAVFTKGGLDELRFAKDARGNYLYNTDDEFKQANPKAAGFIEAYKRIGGSYVKVGTRNEYISNPYGIGVLDKRDQYEQKDDATSLEIILPKKKESAVWFFGYDWTEKDNTHIDDIINTVYSTTKQNKKDLEALGMTFSEDEIGNIHVMFDKSHPYGAAFVAAVGSSYGHYADKDNAAIFIGYDKNGNKIDNSDRFPNGDAHYNGFLTYQAESMYDMYSEAKSKKEKAFNKLNNEDGLRDYSATSWSIPMLSKKANKDYVIDHIKSMAYADYKHYGYTNSNVGTTMTEFDEAHFNEFRKNMNGRNSNQIHLQGMTVNGQTGVLITLDPKLDKDGNPIPNSTEMKMFIPDYLSEIVGLDINNHTDLQAQIEYNNMKTYGRDYVYTFKDGSSAWVDDAGQIRRAQFGSSIGIVDSFGDPAARLVKDINKDFILTKAELEKGRFVNNNGEYNEKLVKQMGQAVAYEALRELYPNLPIETTDGTSITANMLFDDNNPYKNNKEQTTNPAVLNAIDEMFDLYYKIIGNNNK